MLVSVGPPHLCWLHHHLHTMLFPNLLALFQNVVCILSAAVGVHHHVAGADTMCSKGRWVSGVVEHVQTATHLMEPQPLTASSL